MAVRNSEYSFDTWWAERFDTDEYHMGNEHFHFHHEISFNFSHIPIRHTFFGHVYETDTPCIIYRAPFVLHTSSTLRESRYIRYRVDLNESMLSLFDGVISLGPFSGGMGKIIKTTDEQMEILRPYLDLLCQKRKNTEETSVSRSSVGLLAAVLDELRQFTISPSLVSDQKTSYIHHVMEYIALHIGERITADRLAERFFVSRAKLYRDFYRVTNMTLYQYVTTVRLSVAKNLLKEGVSVQKTAEICGYSQASPFIVMFRNSLGITPMEYRNRSK